MTRTTLKRLVLVAAIILFPAIGFADDDELIKAFDSTKAEMDQCLHQMPIPVIQTEDKYEKLIDRYAAICGSGFKHAAWALQRGAMPTWSSSQIDTAAQSWVTMEVTLALGCEFVDPDKPEGTRSVYCTGYRR